MKNRQHLLCFLFMLALFMLAAPAFCAVEPAWTVAATPPGELSCVVISGDGSTVLAGGDQLIAVSHDGHKLWTGWSGTRIGISRDATTIITVRDQVVRMISGSGNVIWEQSLGVPVTEVTMLPDASLIAAGGSNHIRLINRTGAGFRQNASIPETHFRLFPAGDRLVVTSPDGVATSNLTLFSEWADTKMSQDMVEVTADGSAFVTVTNNRVRMYSRNGDLLWNRAVPGGNALSFALSRDGSTIAIGRDDNSLVVLDNAGQILWTATEPSWVESVAVSDDGGTIAAGCIGRTLAVYDRAGTNLGTAVTENPIRTQSVVVSGDGTLIAAVDSGAVYGFSRAQFASAAVTPAAMTATPEAPATTAPVPAVSAALPQPASPAAAPAPTRAGIPASLPLLAAVLTGLMGRRAS